MDLLSDIPKSHPPPDTQLAFQFTEYEGDKSFDLIRWQIPYARITWVTFTGFATGLEDVIHELSTPFALLDGTQRWPCPSLKGVQFEECKSPDAESILQLVQAREAAAAGAVPQAATSETVEGVTALCFLRVIESGAVMNEGTFEVIQHLLAGGGYWDEIAGGSEERHGQEK